MSNVLVGKQLAIDGLVHFIEMIYNANKKNSRPK